MNVFNNKMIVCQHQWAFTSTDKGISTLQTNAFACCFVVTFTYGNKYAALAHIDDFTEIDSIDNIFQRFCEHRVPLKEINVKIMGGWKDSKDCHDQQKLIIERIKRAGCVIINVYPMRKVAYPDDFVARSGKDFAPYSEGGAYVVASTGKTIRLNENDENIERYVGNSLYFKNLDAQWRSGKKSPLMEVIQA